jgi:hypothetical protein
MAYQQENRASYRLPFIASSSPSYSTVEEHHSLPIDVLNLFRQVAPTTGGVQEGGFRVIAHNG